MANRLLAQVQGKKGGPQPKSQAKKPVASEVRRGRQATEQVEVTLDRAGAQSIKAKASILASFKRTGEKYNDPDFPATKTSLTKNWDELDERTHQAWSTLSWKRIDEVFTPPFKVFDSIEPGDIMQGALGDCYFLSALSAIAEFPHRIQKLFDTKDYEPAGVYIVSMLETGVIKDHIVDDYFPVDRSGKAAFSGPKVERGTAELWVVILEKAYANRFGSYDDIQAGFTEDVLRDLTGAPCETFQTGEDYVWDELMNANEAGYIITAASGGDQDEHDTTNALGLVSLHAYSVIEAAEVPTRGGTECLLKIRNPWGATEWQGDWSDNSPLWTPELKRALGWQNVDDGTFWMRLEDFQDWFTSVTICRVNDSFKYNAVLVKQPKGQFKVFEVTLAQAAKVTLTITLPDQRHFGYDSGYLYPACRLVACFVNEQDESENEYLGGRSNIFARDVWREFNTTRPGRLLVFAQVDWETDFTTEFGFSVYSSCASTITDVTDSYPEVLSAIFSPAYARRDTEEKDLGSSVFLYEGQCVGGDDKGRFNEGFLFHHLHNKSRNIQATVEVEFPEFENLELMYPDSGTGYRVVLEPSQFATIVIKHSVLSEQMSFSTRIRKEFQEV
jgi:calpain-15